MMQQKNNPMLISTCIDDSDWSPNKESGSHAWLDE